MHRPALDHATYRIVSQCKKSSTNVVLKVLCVYIIRAIQKCMGFLICLCRFISEYPQSTMSVLLYLTFCIFGVMVTNIRGQTMDNVNNLHQDILLNASYSKHIRPAINQSEPTIVNIEFSIVSIRELDEILGKFSIVGILYLVWEDPRLRWNPAHYGNITETRLDMRKVWKPDLIIAHPMESIAAVGHDHYHYPVRYYANGIGLWAPGDVMTTTCKIDVAYYPFDTQTCEMMFMSWGSLYDEVFLKSNRREIYTDFFVGNGEWDLIESYAYEGMIDSKYPTYNIVFKLKRRPTFIVVNVVLPVLFMGLLNVLAFFVPAQSGERVSFSMTVLLAIAVFLTLVGDNMPKTSEPMSTICYFLLTNLVLSSLIMIITVLNLNVFHKSEKQPVPTFLSNLVLLLSCRRPKRTKVEVISVSEDVHDVDFKKEKEKHDVVDEKWATPVQAEEVNANKATWQDVSRMFDKLFGLLAFVWLFFSASAFFGMVATQTVPGVED